jgi:hypothetical protein
MKDSLFSKWKIGSSFFSKSSNQAEFYIKIGIVLIKNRPNSSGKLRQQNLYKKEKMERPGRQQAAGSKQPAANSSTAGSQPASSLQKSKQPAVASPQPAENRHLYAKRAYTEPTAHCWRACT